MRIRQSFLWSGLVLVAVLLAAAVFLSVVIAPNRFKGKIENAATRATGHRLELIGDISFGVSRWLSLTTGTGAWHSVAAPLGEPLARWRSSDVRLRLLPLLKGRVVLDTIRMDGLHLIVHRDASGRTNWQGAAAPVQTGEKFSPGRLAVGGLDLTNASIDFRDDAGDLAAHVDKLSLRAGEWMRGAEVQLRTEFHATIGRAARPAASKDLEANVKFVSSVQADADFSQFALHATTLDARFSGGTLAVDGIGASLDLPRVAAVIEPLSLEVPTFTLKFDEANATGSVALERAGDVWHARGPLQLAAPSARKILTDLGLDVPLPRDPAMLGKLTLDGTWEVAGGALTVQPLTMQIDATRFDGQIARSAGADPRLTFDLHADRMDLGAYADLTSAHPTPFELPVAALRALNAQGQIVFERARLADSQLKRVTLRVESRE